MRRIIALLLCAALLLSLATGLALAAEEKPRLAADPGVLYLHPGETGTVKLTLKNAQSSAAPKLESEDDEIAQGAGVTALDKGWSLTIRAGSKRGGTHVTAKLVLSSGKTVSRVLSVFVAGNFAPKLKWYHVLINKDNGYPQLKLSMTDDFGLKDVCFVREWTDDDGDILTETYSIVTLADTEAVCFRTLAHPGRYSVQINDNASPAARYNSETLVTLVDVDHNGVADAYYTDDENVLTLLNVDNKTLPPLSREINPN